MKEVWDFAAARETVVVAPRGGDGATAVRVRSLGAGL